ncbi:hypothetical protein L2E82_12592 [Cichorium intybus]|uniref:Uncharacterized protein n=1 Tax=Cichorium intybus TaxID=13427 RepID=A0ACB9GGD1_CICIN|nr:hypothetical protein L2E82_12592 [Cichorium intybus]
MLHFPGQHLLGHGYCPKSRRAELTNTTQTTRRPKRPEYKSSVQIPPKEDLSGPVKLVCATATGRIV